MVLAKGLCDLVWTLWGLLQVMNDNPVEDFWAYSINRFERCKRLMASDDVRSRNRSGPRGLMPLNRRSALRPGGRHFADNA